MSDKARTHQALGQIRTDEECFEIICFTAIKMHPSKKKGINLRRIGKKEFNFTNEIINKIYGLAATRVSQSNKAKGGFIRGNRIYLEKRTRHLDAVTIL